MRKNKTLFKYLPHQLKYKMNVKNKEEEKTNSKDTISQFENETKYLIFNNNIYHKMCSTCIVN